MRKTKKKKNVDKGDEDKEGKNESRFEDEGKRTNEENVICSW